MFESVCYISAGRFTARETWIHPSRCLDSDDVIYVLQGPIRMTVGGRHEELNSGDALALPHGLCHAGDAGSPAGVSFYWVHFRGPEGFRLPFDRLSAVQSAQLDLMWRQLLHIATGDYPPEASDYALRLILVELCRRAAPAQKGSPTAQQIAEWIRVNSDRPLTVAAAAAHFGYNPDYLARVFKRADPRGLKACIDESRMQTIKQFLLSTDLPLKEIARRCGFEDYACFLKFFSYHESLTPTQFRTAFYRQHTNIR